MRNLFFHYEDIGNVSGSVTTIYNDTILGQTLKTFGDQLKLEYIITCTIPTFSVFFNANIAGGFSLDISPNLIQGDNLLEITITKSIEGGTNGLKGIFKFTNANGSSLIYTIVDFLGNFDFNVSLFLTLQDTSGSPTNNTIIAKHGKGTYLPIL